MLTPFEREAIWRVALAQLQADRKPEPPVTGVLKIDADLLPQTRAERDKEAVESPYFDLAVNLACAEFNAMLHDRMNDDAA